MLEKEHIKAVLVDINENIVDKFVEYHRDNPDVFNLVKKYADDLRSAGFVRYSLKSIFERIRWHMDVEVKGDSFKMNNNYTSCYARLISFYYPEHSNMFETRTKS